MPNNYDFSSLQDIKEIEVSPFGWITPLTIEYGKVDEISGETYCWRVKGTKHTFTILTRRMNYISGGDHERHFTEVLEKFREDYMDWSRGNFGAGWMREYQEDFRNFIL